MHFLITGHTGFKGAWLAVLLREMGHEVSGVSLEPDHQSLFARCHLESIFEHDLRGDIRDRATVEGALGCADLDGVFHLAAQPLVRESYRRPRWTMETNVTGTMNVLQAHSAHPTTLGCVVVTTDKVYRNDGRVHGYREDDPLGGADPYSASKAMADLLTQSWGYSFPAAAIAIARAGNVIGGGDVGQDRLIPDLLRSFAECEPALIRNPSSVRPWQHVLDCLFGYLALMQALPRIKSVEAWNFGPSSGHLATVGDIAEAVANLWGGDARWRHEAMNDYHEASILTLDSGKARRELGWRDQLDLQSALEWTIRWARSSTSPEEALAVTVSQVREYLALIPRALPRGEG